MYVYALREANCPMPPTPRVPPVVSALTLPTGCPSSLSSVLGAANGGCVPWMSPLEFQPDAWVGSGQGDMTDHVFILLPYSSVVSLAALGTHI